MVAMGAYSMPESWHNGCVELRGLVEFLRCALKLEPVIPKQEQPNEGRYNADFSKGGIVAQQNVFGVIFGIIFLNGVANIILKK